MEDIDIAKKFADLAVEIDDWDKSNLPSRIVIQLKGIVEQLHDTAALYAGDRIDEIYAPEDPIP
jgi:hypothetical protein